MRPCDCKDMCDIRYNLNEAGVKYNEYGIEVAPMSVFIETGNCTLRLPMTIFKRFAEWYQEDQIKEE
jgi:hypothetical protein